MADDDWGAGDRNKWSDHGTVKIGKRDYPLIYGEHPYSRSDNRHYVDMGEGREAVGFDGHRPLISVQLDAQNYLKESYLSGDEVRKGGSGRIISDGEVVWEFFFRDINWGLREADRLINELREHSSFWLMKRQREQLIGRAIYYREVPAIITSLVVDQGCIMVETESGQPFPPPVYAEDGDDDRDTRVKLEVTSPQIWWHRERKIVT